MNMAGNVLCEHFAQKLKDRYEDKKYSDVILKIVEESNIQQNENQSKVIHAHAIILDMNSPYFEKALLNHKQGPSELEVRVKKGETRLIEIIISSFYDEKVINDLNITDLICILELSVIYGSEKLVKQIISLLEKLQPDFEASNFGLNKIFCIEQGDTSNINEELRSAFKSRFTSFLVKYFSPIEEKQDRHKEFMSLEYSSLFYMLRSNEQIAISENSLLTFVITWLEYDTARQTGNNIKGLLESIRVKYLNGTFLYLGVGLEHRILNKWDGFRSWIYNCIGFLVMPANERKRNPGFDNSVCRNTSPDMHGWYTKCKNKKLCAIRWLVHMTPVEEGKRFCPVEHNLVHDGMKFTSESIEITPIEGDASNFNMTLKVGCSQPMLGVRFVVGIVPADKQYDITNKYFYLPFASSFLKWTEPSQVEMNSQEFDYWVVSKDFVDIGNQYGLYVCLLPVTNEEFLRLSVINFQCVCEYYSYKVVNDGGTGRCGSCNRYATSNLDKISLIASTNFSV